MSAARSSCFFFDTFAMIFMFFFHTFTSIVHKTFIAVKIFPLRTLRSSGSGLLAILVIRTKTPGEASVQFLGPLE